MGFMKPNIPTPAAAPPPPAVEDVDAKKQEYQSRLRQRRGRVAAVMNEGGTAETASKVLLGA